MCIAAGQQTVSVDFDMTSTAGSIPGSGIQIDIILQHIQTHISVTASYDTISIFVTMVGVYVGAAVDNVRSSPSVIQRLREQITSAQNIESIILQRCNDVPNADLIDGVAVDTRAWFRFGNLLLRSVMDSVS
ncbi:glycoside hydrolase family 18 protein [Penicillium subrubescens]|nr:glycoside hydrolase family 18 protein [Penicillium subrubescens]KAJ5883334.1 glycoside hydrolase family 18 protein [Penicillium subrubescens]